MEVCTGNECLCFKTLYFSYRLDYFDAKWGWQAYTTPTVRGISTFAVFFSVSRPFCRFTLVYEGQFVLCCKEKIPLGGGGGTWPMFGYRGAAEGLKSWPCLGQKYAKNPTLCRTTASISIPCLGQVTNAHRLYLQEFKLFLRSHSNQIHHVRCV